MRYKSSQLLNERSKNYKKNTDAHQATAMTNIEHVILLFEFDYVSIILGPCFEGESSSTTRYRSSSKSTCKTKTSTCWC